MWKTVRRMRPQLLIVALCAVTQAVCLLTLAVGDPGGAALKIFAGYCFAGAHLDGSVIVYQLASATPAVVAVLALSGRPLRELVERGPCWPPAVRADFAASPRVRSRG